MRIAKEKGAFEKAYLTNWTSEQFIISKVILTVAGRYKYLLEDLSGEPLIGTFQKEELQKVTEQRRQIQKVVKRTPRGTYVRWRGHPDSRLSFSQKRKTLAVFRVHLSQKRNLFFCCQIILLYVVVVAAIVNLSYPPLAESRSALWISLLSSSIGYILPHPTFKTPRSLTPVQKS